VSNVLVVLASIGINPAASLGLLADERVGAEVAEDWAAVANAIDDRLAQLRVTQMDVAARAKISLTTLRELQHNTSPRRRRPQTLSALSEALDWPTDYLAKVLSGDNARPHADEERDLVLKSLTSIERELRQLRDRVDRIERQLAGEGG
jgi:transcriptional regulator with XRE-family HTH domain